MTILTAANTDSTSPRGTLPVRKKRRWGIAALVVVLACVGSVVAAWFGGLDDQFVPRRWGAVTPGLIYRSGQLSDRVVGPTLRENGVKVIVNLGVDKPHKPDQAAELRAARELEIERTTLFLNGDGTGPIASYAEAVEIVCRARSVGKPVLIHCSAGTQRTGAAVAFYRVLVEGKPPAQAVAELRKYNWTPQDNPALLPYINGHMRELATLLVGRGVLERVPEPLPVLTP